MTRALVTRRRHASAPSELKRLRVTNGWASHARFLANVSDEPIGEIPRVTSIPSPYAYSPVDTVWLWNGKRIIVRETYHRRHEVFEVPMSMTVTPCEP